MAAAVEDELSALAVEVSPHANFFASLPPEEQEAVRAAQRRRKEAKLQARKTHEAPAAEPCEGDAFPCSITRETYFAACEGGLFRDPSLPPTQQGLKLLMSVLEGEGDHVRSRPHTR